MKNSIGLGRLIRTAHPVATRLVVLACVIFGIKVLGLNRLEAPSRAVYEFGVIFEAVLASVVASYIFYLFVVHLQELRDETIVNAYLNRHVMRVVGDCEEQLRTIANAANVPVTLDTALAPEINRAFAAINPMSADAGIRFPDGQPGNWYDLFGYHRDRTRRSIARALTKMPYMDARLVVMLAEIDECPFFEQMEFFRRIPLANQSLSDWAGVFVDYCRMCRELHHYRERHLATGCGTRLSSRRA